MTSPDEQPRLISNLFEGSSPQTHSSKWTKLWDENWTPWDRGGSSLALYDLLKENPGGLISLPEPSRPKTALVPGCGRGHDVLLLSSFGYDVCGLDVSSKAIEAAKENEEKAMAEGLYKTEGYKQGVITWVCQDFFAADWPDVKTRFDLIFDYTVRGR